MVCVFDYELTVCLNRMSSFCVQIVHRGPKLYYKTWISAAFKLECEKKRSEMRDIPQTGAISIAPRMQNHWARFVWLFANKFDTGILENARGGMHIYMMSKVEGEGASKKHMRVLLSCMSVTVTKGRGGSINIKILRTSYLYDPLWIVPPHLSCDLHKYRSDAWK